MRNMSWGLLMLLSWSVHAEVFKCIEKNSKPVYQNSPCKEGAKEQQLNIKSDPEQEAAAKARLDSIRNEYQTRKMAKEEQERAVAAQRNQALSLEFARRSAAAQQDQAQAQQRQATALERQNQNDNRDYYLWPAPGPGPRPAPPSPPAQQPSSERRPGDNMNPPMNPP